MTAAPGSALARRPLALTMGEPAGIGGEIAMQAWRRRQRSVPPFFLIDDPERLRRLSRRLELDVPVREIDRAEEALAVYPNALPVLPQPLAGSTTPGTPDPANAPAVLGSIDRAVALAMKGEAAAVVTNPIHKRTLYEAGFPLPGHTEYLAEIAQRGGAEAHAVMMLACPGLRVVPVTIHMSLRAAIAALTSATIVEAARITWAALRTDFGIAEPQLAIAALNPHAGEGGHMGEEEADIIAPAVTRLKRMGIAAFGPAPADTLFHSRARETYDAALCMYHDQALIPLKTIDFDGGVNITLGLPFVRTSPDHGTALTLAGTGTASETSLVAALRTAFDMAWRRSGPTAARLA